jgi:DnaJ-class molecular chaperone
MSTNYFVIQETTTLQWCETCKGSGKKTRTFKGQKFTNNCFMCGGTGKREVKKTTHVTLQEALHNIGACSGAQKQEQ